MIKIIKKVIVGGAVLFILMQFIPAQRSNPGVSKDVPAPPEVKTLLVKSCYDCHSNQTTWPFYSFIAPASWLVSRDVVVGRAHMNFSRWDTYSREEKESFKTSILAMTKNKIMPPSQYLLIHTKAAVDSAGQSLLETWNPSSNDTTMR